MRLPLTLPAAQATYCAALLRAWSQPSRLARARAAGAAARLRTATGRLFEAENAHWLTA